MSGYDHGVLTPVSSGTRYDELTADAAWVRDMLRAEAALARAQAALGVVPDEVARTITAVAEDLAIDFDELAAACRQTANPVVGLIAQVRRAVAAQDASAAEYVHRGSTSQDVMDTALMLVVQRCARATAQDLDDAADAFDALAARHPGTVTVARTLALHAVPTTVGHRFAGWSAAIRGDAERLRHAADDIACTSLGGSAGTASGYLEFAAIDGGPDLRPGTDYYRELGRRFAAELGLRHRDLPWHSLRSPLVELLTALATACGTAGKIATDSITLGRNEIGELREPAPEGRGRSSAMPQKRNPVLATLIRSAALQTPGLVSTALACMTGADERSAGEWHAEWNVTRQLLRLTGGAAATLKELAQGLTVDVDAVRRNLELTGSGLVAERLAVHLTATLGRVAAGELVARLSTESGGDRDALVRAVRSAVPDADLPWDDLADPAGYLGVAGR